MIQKYITEWASACYDLFGSEDSSHAAAYFATGLKGRFREAEEGLIKDHLALDDAYQIDVYEGGRWSNREIPVRRAMNALLLDAYVKDCTRALKRWNAILEEHGVSARLTLPSIRFNRKVGVFAEQHYDIQGHPTDEAGLRRGMETWMPTAEDYALVSRSRVPVYEPGKVANRIAPPVKGVEGKPLDFQYVLFH